MWYIRAMTRDAAIARLKAHEAELKKLGVEHLYLFGSTARGDAREASDIDLFFDHQVGAIGLYELMDIKQRAAEILGSKTDMIPRRGLHHVLRKRIEASALQVF
jgi:predicted nucleotidyltransferase